MSKLFRLALAILIATPLTASAQNAPATEAITLTGPGKFAGVFEVKTQATIAAVDPAARSVVLARKNGTQLTLVVGDTVKNFEQIKVGDRVVTRHTQAVVEFNRMVSEDPRVENVIIPLRDGLNLIRVK